MDKLSKLREFAQSLRDYGGGRGMTGHRMTERHMREYADRLTAILNETEPEAEPAADRWPSTGISVIKTSELESLRAENARLVARLAALEADALASVKSAVMSIPNWKIDGRWISAENVWTLVEQAAKIDAARSPK